MTRQQRLKVSEPSPLVMVRLPVIVLEPPWMETEPLPLPWLMLTECTFVVLPLKPTMSLP